MKHRFYQTHRCLFWVLLCVSVFVPCVNALVLNAEFRSSGTASSFTHDPLGRIVGYSANNGASNFIQRTLTRNALGFKTHEQIQAGLEVLTASSSQTHGHNSADQIIAVEHAGPVMDVTPWYDANGNVTQVVQVVQTQVGGISFTNRYEYDFDNRLVAVESPMLVGEYLDPGSDHRFF